MGLADSPWPKLQQNQQNTGLSPYGAYCDGTVKWTHNTGEEFWADSPVIGSDGTIYVCTEDDCTLYAINPDGSLKWRFATPVGTRYFTCPAVASDGTIYFVGFTASYSLLFAVNPDGSEKWNWGAGYTFYDTVPAIGSDGTIYVCADDNSPPNENYLFAINPDGSDKWQFYVSSGAQTSSGGPAIDSSGNIVFSDMWGRVYSVKPDGTQNWVYFDGSDTNVVHTPAIDNSDNVYVGTQGGYLKAIDSSGNELWKYGPVNYIESCPAIGSDGTIYFQNIDATNYLYAINPNGTLKWRYDLGNDYHYSSPIIDVNGIIYVGSGDNGVRDNFYAINPNGTLNWSYGPTGAGWYAFGGSAAIASDGTIYATCYDGKLYAFLSVPSTYTISGNVKDSDGNNLSNVTISLEDSTDYSTSTDNNGNYSQIVDPDVYTVTASKDKYLDSSASVDATTSDQTQNFVLLKPVISGNIKDNKDYNINGVVVTFTDGTSYETTTDSDGNYSQEVDTGEYTVVASLAGYTSSSADVNATTGDQTQDFILDRTTAPHDKGIYLGDRFLINDLRK